MTLYKYTCGCVGLLPEEDGRALIVYPCDGGEVGPELTVRDTREMTKEGDPIPVTNSLEAWKKVTILVQDGYAFRDVRRLLGVPK